MKTITFFLVFLLFIFFACKKDQSENRPDWLSDKVSEVISSEDICYITTVSVFEYNKNYYYNIYCGFWSCLYCHLYDANGNKPDWDDETHKLFIEKKVLIEEYPACE